METGLVKLTSLSLGLYRLLVMLLMFAFVSVHNSTFRLAGLLVLITAKVTAVVDCVSVFGTAAPGRSSSAAASL